MRRIRIGMIFIVMVGVPAMAYGEGIITPAAAGAATGSQYFPLQNAFDAQPAWDDVNEEPSGGGTTGSDAPYYASRHGYIDFGEDWADVRITGTWTMYRAWSGGNQTGYAAMWWDDDYDNVNDDGVTESTLDFNSAQGVSNIAYTQWLQDVDCSASPITPQRRYLILAAPSTMTNRAKEYAIIGYIQLPNEAPVVDAGSDALVSLASGAGLDGTVSDDGLPDPPAGVSVLWTKTSGPGTVTFGDDEAVDTTAGFSVSGTYVLRLTADDGDLTAYDEVTITVNAAPSVDAGSDDTITLPNEASLDATVSDDGIPASPGTVTTLWTKTSGPGTVTFDDDEAVDTDASFSTSGVYVLRLTADDGDLTSYDEVTITVNPTNTAPSVDAGSNDTITLPATASLDGTVSDDGHPNPPGSVTTTWTKISGAGTVTFGNANAVDTTVSFSAAGTYVLRLTADDGDLDAYDEVTITVNAAAGVEGIITPVASGAATGSAYFPLQNAFDSQPTWDSDNDIPVGTETGSGAPAYANRYGYIDFGEDWMFVRITQTWTLYRTWSGGNHSGYVAMWWDDDKDTINDEGLDETRLNFNSAQSLPNVNEQLWAQDVDCTSAPVAPLGRYLIIQSPSTVTSRANEYAIVGYTVSPTKTILTPQAAGAIPGGMYFPLQNAFDGQPTWDDQNEEPLGGSGVSDAPAYANRYGYIDFGADYRKVRITAAWTKYRTWSGTSHFTHSGYSEMWWDDDTDNWNDGITENTLSFNFASYLPHVNEELWAEDASVADNAPIIPQGRYLILKSPPTVTDRAKEYAFVGWISDVSFPEPARPETPFLTLDRPQTFDYSSLTLIDEVICGDPNETHTLIESVSGVSEVQTILGQQVRVMPNVGNDPKYFGYVLGQGDGLQAGKAYVLVVEYPEDTGRSMVVINHGAETNRGFHTGTAVGDCLTPVYVNSNPESLHYGFSGNIEQWEQLFHLHNRFPDIIKPRGSGARTKLPADGFQVLISQYAADEDPTSAGAAVKRIALYEAPSLESYTQELAVLPEGLPKRHLFWREEMSDGVLAYDATYPAGVTEDSDWYEYKARLHKFLGMNTFCKDLLEFGHNQGWNAAKYGGAGSEWFMMSSIPHRWEKILIMLNEGNYGLDVLPYYEYCGSEGTSATTSIGKLKRSRPLGDTNHDGYYTTADPYTHITWAEIANVDVSDSDALTDIQRLMECTQLEFKEGLRPKPLSNSDGSTPTWNADKWGYIDFGADWADVRICQTWTRSRQWHGGAATPYSQVYWHSNYADFSGGNVPQGAIAESTVNFITNYQPNAQNTWTKDVDLSVANAITPQGRYLLLKAPNPIRDCREYLIVGYIDGVSTDLDVIPVTAGSASGFSLAALFDDQPGLYTTSLNFVGAWLRPRSAAIPMGFDDTTLARFSADNSITPAVTRSNLVSGGYLNAYYDWWFDQRKAYLNEVRDYLRTNVNEDAVVLYTYDHSESGVSHPSGQPGVITDDLPTWGDIVSGAMSYNAAVESELHYEAMTLPAYNWSYWEWPHAVPRGDAPNYQNNEGVMMEYVFNKMYTVPEPDWFQEYRTQSGLACIYHYCLNEDMMTNSSDTDIVGYFVSDMELAGPYCMLPEARAVANGDPYYIGYLSSNSFNRGFPGYAREFNANFLALPALEMTTETSATAVEGVVVRSITTQSDGTWLAIINTSFEDKEAVEITLPVSGAVTEAVTGDSVTVTGGKITLDLWPGQLKTLRIQ